MTSHVALERNLGWQIENWLMLSAIVDWFAGFASTRALVNFLRSMETQTATNANVVWKKVLMAVGSAKAFRVIKGILAMRHGGVYVLGLSGVSRRMVSKSSSVLSNQN